MKSKVEAVETETVIEHKGVADTLPPQSFADLGVSPAERIQKLEDRVAHLETVLIKHYGSIA